MANPIRVFLSHATEDTKVAERIADDLRAAGADVWLDSTHLGPGDFVASINRALDQRDVLVLVLSPAAIRSSWVPDEMDAAIVRYKQGLMQSPVIAEIRSVPVKDIPSLWTIYSRTDFTRNYDRGMAHLFHALHLPVPKKSKPRPPATQPSDAGATDSSDGTAPKRGGVVSRRALLVGTVVAAGLSIIGGAALLKCQGPSILSSRMRSLGFMQGTTSGTIFIAPPLVNAAAGDFLMGSNPARDDQAQPDEQPQFHLTLPALQVGKYPVTVAEYAAFVRTGHPAPPQWGAQQDKPDHPVVWVSWKDAQAYAAWLTQLTGEKWHLPTEPEWEKAARGTDGRIYPWGDAFDKARTNTSESGIGTTTPVGSYPIGASPYGAQDMAGNVWEWTSSLYGPYPYSIGDALENSNGTGIRVLRGGSWFRDAKDARAAYRLSGLAPSADSAFDIGFRLVREALSS